jgi:hypothetical protein
MYTSSLDGRKLDNQLSREAALDPNDVFELIRSLPPAPSAPRPLWADGLPSRLPVPEGVAAPEDRMLEAAPTASFNPRGTSFADIQHDHVIFNHGALMTLGGMEIDPVQEWVELQPGSPVVGTFDMRAPYITGLAWTRPGDALPPESDRDWERRYVITSRETWPGLLDHVRGVSVINLRKRSYVETFVTMIPWPDPFDPARSFYLTLFGLTGNRGRMRFVVPSVGPIRAVIDPPDPAIVRIASALFDGHSNPLSLKSSEDPGAR